MADDGRALRASLGSSLLNAIAVPRGRVRAMLYNPLLPKGSIGADLVSSRRPPALERDSLWGTFLPFNAPLFLFLFLPLFMLAYHLTGRRLKLVFGVLGSLIFYAWGNLIYVPLMIVLTLATYALGRGIEGSRGSRLGVLLVWVGSLAITALLLVYKLLPGVQYPLGLSYVTFQAVSYLLEVHKRRIETAPDLVQFSFYLLLFPKLPVGPITRYSQVRAQISDLRPAPLEMADGLRRFIRGLAKKVLIADTLAAVVNPIFSLASPAVAPSIAWLVLVSYALQIFFDFSGYTDMAIGLGRMLGLSFPENFDFPYLSKSIADFWRRWHISLASWFRDFVFYPLERRRLRRIGQPLNVLLVFLLVGLWHGIAWSFVIWGLIQGVALVFESTRLGKRIISLPAPLSNLYALAVILLGWVFFRSPTPAFALRFLLRLAGDTRGLTVLPFDLTNPLPIIEPTFVMALVAGLLLCLPLGRYLQQVLDRLVGDAPTPRLAAPILADLGLLAVLLASIAAIASSAFTPALYAKF